MGFVIMAFQRRILISFLKLFDIVVIGMSSAFAAMAVFYKGSGVAFIEFLKMRVSIHNFIFFVVILVCGHIAAYGMYQSRRSYAAVGHNREDSIR
jgi:hypothetical protein